MAKAILSDQSFGGVSRITNLPPPVAPHEPARLAELNAAIEGLKQKDPVRVSTQGNINLASPGAAVDGVPLAANDRVLVRLQTVTSENGIYSWTGAATPMVRSPDADSSVELNNALTLVVGGTNANTNFRQTALIAAINVDPVTWTTFGTGSSLATETLPGVVELATQAEVDAGVDTQRVPTPATLAAWTGKKFKYAADIGDGSATQFDVTHNFNTRDSAVSVVRAAAPFDDVQCDITRPDTNTVRLNFVQAPTANQYRVVIVA